MVWTVSKQDNFQVLFFLFTCLFLLCPDPGWADTGTAIIPPGTRNDQTMGKYKEGELWSKFKADSPAGECKFLIILVP